MFVSLAVRSSSSYNCRVCFRDEVQDEGFDHLKVLAF
uniref:Uncharacterized protein n=1 Tax=Anguilla anguilla TaxID=7936 RepID=A0A0E9RE70_ANGAN